ncbi:FtsX-like permease family protein [Dictyobacter aurantiacus]|uniref:ABC3 transporter permease C-terminal domain-containing protein n=1 Tax=Dictyobacter aurantiacus TaxID=1936993 RepID=A0A401ZBB8_9CHLR|nr:FtsX-like permease family protein [Dictyobacter aurantiacus]GCE04126.1 hypothetical protein KDAU_14550 [Dictyobacter aurantiacus]
MTQFFGTPLDQLTPILMIVTGIIMGGTLILAIANVIFFKIGLRNVSRRRTQMGLIVFALMLSTTLLSGVLATGDVMTSAVQSVAVYNWGNIDELVEGGHGALGTYSLRTYIQVKRHAQTAPDIAAVGADLHDTGLLLADQTSRQVRSNVGALAVLPDSELGFGGLTDASSKRPRRISALADNAVYLNQSCASLLNARAGDRLYLYSSRWPGRRYTMNVVAIVNNTDIVGDQPVLISNLHTFQKIENEPGRINQILIANRGGGGVNGVSLSDQVEDQVERWLPGDVHVIQVKQQGVQTSQNAQDIFSRIFSLFALFALAIGLLLIFLIFVLLAAERRSEMGIARAIGVQRRHLILMYLFEGTAYDLISSLVGLLAGFGLGAALIYFLGPLLVRFNFPLKFSFQPRSLLIAYCLGVIFTFFSVALASWLVSRMTVSEAIRDLPEPARVRLPLHEQGTRLYQLSVQLRDCLRPGVRNWRRARRILFEHVPEVALSFLITLTVIGIVPLLAGILLVHLGLNNEEVIPFSLGLSLFVFGGVLLLKTLLLQSVAVYLRLRRRYEKVDFQPWSYWIDGAVAALIGLSWLAYWALPFDALAQLGLPRFQAGIEVFFVAGVMMVLGTVWTLSANARLLTVPFLVLFARIPAIFVVLRLALAYPLQRRLRTGLSVIMFSLVVFAMTVMAVITNAMQNSYVDINTQTGGYDIQATAYFKAIPNLQQSLAAHGISSSDFSAIGVRRTTALGVLQPGAPSPRWSVYPAQVVNGGFLQGYGTHLIARAQGFQSDDAVWQALRQHPDYALIDSGALPYDPNRSFVYDPSAANATTANVPKTPPGFDPNLTFTMSGVSQGDTSFLAVPLWVIGLHGKTATKITVIGVVDNSDSAHFGLYVPQAAYDASQPGIVPGSTNSPQNQSYYFKVAPGHDPRAVALQLGSAYLDDGLETTVLADIIWQARGPRILLSNVLLAVVGLVLLLGMAALALIGTRAVIERRQQIGMLRAMGSSRLLIQGAFLLESFLIGALGSMLGIVLGVILSRNIFAANFFEQYQTGLVFSIPWQQLGLIVAISLAASFLGAVLPAWQAGRVAPAEALRYS